MMTNNAPQNTTAQDIIPRQAHRTTQQASNCPYHITLHYMK